ncbi:CCT motif [Carpediemonas membranifera]|uniref:CCT motif n=1 Tax=Carpediemonas membranifera TaxID=201153 RepID=A0A8J6E0R8_9EUKA|nr:CCT motif [Carpediemonas membranifera]|eukprot:KAG9395454.1 CCT motif [Carpediemonas membranifera]
MTFTIRNIPFHSNYTINRTLAMAEDNNTTIDTPSFTITTNHVETPTNHNRLQRIPARGQVQSSPLVLHVDSSRFGHDGGDNSFHLLPIEETPTPDLSKKTEQRRAILKRFFDKRRKRQYGKHITYVCRKSVADRRKRVKGRFVGSSKKKSSDADEQDANPVSGPEANSPEPEIRLNEPEIDLDLDSPTYKPTNQLTDISWPAESEPDDSEDESSEEEIEVQPRPILRMESIGPVSFAPAIGHVSHRGSPTGLYPQVSPQYSPIRVNSPTPGEKDSMGLLPGMAKAVEPMDFEEFIMRARQDQIKDQRAEG